MNIKKKLLTQKETGNKEQVDKNRCDKYKTRLEQLKFTDTQLICTQILNMWFCLQKDFIDDLLQLANFPGKKNEFQRKEEAYSRLYNQLVRE